MIAAHSRQLPEKSAPRTLTFSRFFNRLPHIENLWDGCPFRSFFRPNLGGCGILEMRDSGLELAPQASLFLLRQRQSVSNNVPLQLSVRH